MLRVLLGRWKEGKALGAIKAALEGRGPLDAAVEAAQALQSVGTRHAIPTLCLALTHGAEALRAEAPAALAAIHKRDSDSRVLEALNAAVLSERQSPKVRVAAIEALAGIVTVRHVGSFIETLKSSRTPLDVRAAAASALKSLGYPELLERLVENYLFDRNEDPTGAVRQWVIGELRALEDREKLTKLHEIAHGRRRLRYRSFSFERGDPAAVVHLMAEVDPEHAVRFLSHMADHSTTVISAAAAEVLREIKSKHKREKAP